MDMSFVYIHGVCQILNISSFSSINVNNEKCVYFQPFKCFEYLIHIFVLNNPRYDLCILHSYLPQIFTWKLT